MRVFFDTSALLKRYVSEQGSDAVDKLFDLAEEIVLSQVTKIEAYSALNRRLREGTLTSIDFATVSEELETDLPYFSVVPFGPELEDQCLELLALFPLRALEAIQLASSMLALTDTFVTADAQLGKAAKRATNTVAVV